MVTRTIAIIALFHPITNWAQDPGSSSSESVVQLTDSYFRIGSVHLDKDKREVYLKGKVNMVEGMIELLACGSRGKTHESILVLELVPHDLQVALLLLGCDSDAVQYNEDSTQVIGGNKLDISVSWNEGKKTVSAQDLIRNVETGNIPEASWVFIGSQIVNGQFFADQEESIITTYHDPYSIIDFAGFGADNDELFEINSDVVPPPGTAVDVTLKALF